MRVLPQSQTLQAPTTGLAGQRHLAERHFAMMLLAALVLHVMVLLGYSLLPKKDAMEVPVRVLKLKVGGGSGQGVQMQTAKVPAPQPVQQVEAPKTELAKPKPKTLPKNVAKPKPKKVNVTKELAKQKPKPQVRKKPLKQVEVMSPPIIAQPTVASPPSPYSVQAQSPTQFVREVTGLVSSGAASQQGVAQGETIEEVRTRYEAIVGNWVKRQIQYPEAARQQGIRGDGTVRIRIDRQGNVRFASIEKSTGYSILDQEMLNTVYRANPVPAVPANYPAGRVVEFLLPMRMGSMF